MRAEADEQTYRILDEVTEAVTGEKKHYTIGRDEETLRRRLERDHRALRAAGLEPDPLRLDLVEALEVAAENSRDFQRQKESLYRVALSLTRTQFDFAVQWFGGNSSAVDGVGDESADATVSSDLRASLNTTTGTRIVGSFVNTFLKDLVNGGDWDGSSILDLSITQPLLRGARRRVVREPLTQAERNVVYAVRDFERFRESLAVQIVSEYLSVLQVQENLDSVRRNLRSVRQSREQIEELYDAGRRDINDLDRARQSELTAENNLANARNRAQQALDDFKFTLGLAIDTPLELDPLVFDQVESVGILPVEVSMREAARLALLRRYDYRTVCDEVDDAARALLIAEDGLRSFLDLSGAVAVPTDDGQPLDLDYSNVSWSAGFDLELALAILPERNAYRSALIALDNAIRSREEFEDRIKQQIRNGLRDIQNQISNYEIQKRAVELAQRRVDSTTRLYEFGRAQALDVLDAQDALLQAEFGLTAAVVDYAISRLQLLLDLEAIQLDTHGLVIDLDPPLPTSLQDTEDARRARQRRERPRSWESDQPWQQLHQGFGGTESDPDGGSDD